MAALSLPRRQCSAGASVTIDMLITTTMTFFVVRYGWKYPWSAAVAATGFFFRVDFTYYVANVANVVDPGWSRSSSARACLR